MPAQCQPIVYNAVPKLCQHWINISCLLRCLLATVVKLIAFFIELRSQQIQSICITFVHCLTNVDDVGPTLYKWYTHILCLLGCNAETQRAWTLILGIQFQIPVAKTEPVSSQTVSNDTAFNTIQGSYLTSLLDWTISNSAFAKTSFAFLSRSILHSSRLTWRVFFRMLYLWTLSSPHLAVFWIFQNSW